MMSAGKKKLIALTLSAYFLFGCGERVDLYSPREKDELYDKKTETTVSSSTTTEYATAADAVTGTTTEALEEPEEIIGGYWREKLTSQEIKIYDKICESQAKCENEVYIDKVVDLDTVDKIVRYVREDHPEFFWIWINYHTLIGSGYTRITFEIIHGIDKNNYMDYKARLDSEVDEIIANIPAGADDYTKVLSVHDQIVRRTEYAIDYSEKTLDESQMYYNAYGCLVDRLSVCEGYTKAFKIILDRLGIRCGTVSGTSVDSGEGHAWNYVMLEGEYYWIDVTWDDPIAEGDENAGEIYVKDSVSRKQFCISTEQLLRDHIIDEEDNIFVPECTSEKYRYSALMGRYFEDYSFEQFNRIFEDDPEGFSVEFSNAEVYQAALDDLITNNNIFNTDLLKSKNDLRIIYSRDDERYVLTVYFIDD